MRENVVLTVCALAFLTGCASESSRHVFESPDVPPSRYTGEIDYASLEQPHTRLHTVAEDSPAPQSAPVVETNMPEPDVPAAKRVAPGNTRGQTIVSINAARVMEGTVSVVNAGAGVCVLNFPIGQLPPVNQALAVYRRGVHVGEIKITGPARDDNIAADIVTGAIEVGDQARDR